MALLLGLDVPSDVVAAATAPAAPAREPSASSSSGGGSRFRPRFLRRQRSSKGKDLGVSSHFEVPAELPPKVRQLVDYN